jgi:rubredoxin
MSLLSNDIYRAFSCDRCNYTVSLDQAPRRCPRCGDTSWHIATGPQDTNLIMCCCWCDRVDLHDGEGYVTAEVAEERLGGTCRTGLVSHGICPECYAVAYAKLG